MSANLKFKGSDTALSTTTPTKVANYGDKTVQLSITDGQVRLIYVGSGDADPTALSTYLPLAAGTVLELNVKQAIWLLKDTGVVTAKAFWASSRPRVAV